LISGAGGDMLYLAMNSPADTRSSSTPVPFPNQTAWSTILGASDRTSSARAAHFERLVGAYWKPVFGYLLRRWGCPREEARDLTQDFFLRLFDLDLLQGASPERGRFRTFLKLQLRNLVVDDLRRKSSLKRGGGVAAIRIDSEKGVEPQWAGLSPEEEFDRVWARELLTAALEELEAALTAEGKATMFRAFWNCAIATPPMSYQDAAQKLGVKPEDVKNYVYRGRQQFKDVLIRRVREYVDREDEVEDELNTVIHLFTR
jgi:RNA polymerase sigma factor (sigma-70 family)